MFLLAFSTIFRHPLLQGKGAIKKGRKTNILGKKKKRTKKREKANNTANFLTHLAKYGEKKKKVSFYWTKDFFMKFSPNIETEIID